MQASCALQGGQNADLQGTFIITIHQYDVDVGRYGLRHPSGLASGSCIHSFLLQLAGSHAHNLGEVNGAAAGAAGVAAAGAAAAHHGTALLVTAPPHGCFAGVVTALIGVMR